jgi:predicted nucleic acid-binding protein
VKLVVRERESDALQAAAGAWERWVTSAIALVEVQRVVRRAADEPAVHERARHVLDACGLLAVDGDVLDRAARLTPARLRGLDAIHLATALSLNEDLGAFAAYDHLLADAARAAGISVIGPAPSSSG